MTDLGAIAGPFGLDVVVKATVVLGLVALVFRLGRDRSAAFRHRAGVLGLAGLLVLPVLALLLPRFRAPLLLVPTPSAIRESAAVGRRRAQEGSDVGTKAVPRIASEAARAVPTDVSPETTAEVAARTAEVAARTAEVAARGAASAVPAVRTASRRSFPMPTVGDLFLLAAAAWAAGCLLVLARLALGLLKVHRLVRGSAEFLTVSPNVPKVRVRVSEEAPVAMATGLVRQTVVLPEAALSWPAERTRAVLLHELAHLQRRDTLTNVLAELVAALYWFHPLVWLTVRRVRDEAERAADDRVLEGGMRASDYAGELLAVVRSLSPNRSRLRLAMAMAEPSRLEGRVMAILDPSVKRSLPTRVGTSLLAAGTLAAVVGVAMLPICAPRRAEAAAGLTPEVGWEQARLARAESLRGVSSSAASGSISGGVSGGISGGVRGGVRGATPSMVLASRMALAGRKVPRNGAGWYDRGMDLHHDEEWEEAIQAFQKAFELGYREGTTAYNIACGYARLEQKDKAFEWLEKSAELGFDLSGYLGSDDDLDSLRGDPRWRTLKDRMNASARDRKKGEAKAARERLDRLIAKAPTRGNAIYDTAYDLYHAHDFEPAARGFLEAAAKGYREGTALYNAACSYALAGQTEPALETLRKAILQGFESADHIDEDDDFDSVRSDKRFRELVKLAESLEMGTHGDWRGWADGHGWSWISDLWGDRSERRREWRDVERKFERFVEKSPEIGRAWSNLGYARLMGDRPEGAPEAFQKALDLGYRKPTTMYNLACAYARTGNTEKAFQWLFASLDAGFSGHSLRDDEDLRSLRRDPRFRKAVKQAEDNDDKD